MNKQTLKPFLIAAFQRSYRLKWVVARVYWALAEREPGKNQQEMLQMLALKAERTAVCYAVRLHRLGGTLPSNADLRHDRLWRWLLVGHSHWAIVWIEWLEKREATLYLCLFTYQFETHRAVYHDPS